MEVRERLRVANGCTVHGYGSGICLDMSRRYHGGLGPTVAGGHIGRIAIGIADPAVVAGGRAGVARIAGFARLAGLDVLNQAHKGPLGVGRVAVAVIKDRSDIPAVDAPADVVDPEFLGVEPFNVHTVLIGCGFGRKRFAVVADFELPRDPRVVVCTGGKIRRALTIFQECFIERMFGNDNRTAGLLGGRSTGIGFHIKERIVAVYGLAVCFDEVGLNSHAVHRFGDVQQTDALTVGIFHSKAAEFGRRVFSFRNVAIGVHESPVGRVVRFSLGVGHEDGFAAGLDRLVGRLLRNREGGSGRTVVGEGRRGHDDGDGHEDSDDQKDRQKLFHDDPP